MNTRTKQELIQKLEAFSTAALDLSRAWEELGRQSVLDDILSTGYPLPTCFMETAAAISFWCGNAVERLRVEHPDNAPATWEEP
jgi:hypothetical protein